MSADFIPEPYIDSNKVVKLFLFRKATDLEKSQMIQFSDDVNINKEIIGKPAINFIASDLLGNTYSLDQLKGKLIVINFWFVECKPCVMEIPDLNQLVQKYKNKDVVFLGIALSNKDKIQSFLKSKPFKYNIIPDAQDIASKYNILSYPTHMIIDKNSIVIYTNSGLSPTTISDLDKIIGTQIK
jgi:thiol-disulfide isomerase/thioredoxin